ncbi:hypothetical protein Ndes2437B_g01501 [Nannochloris sp. 'desiccata']
MACTAQNLFASLNLHCLFRPQTVSRPRTYKRHKINAVVSEPKTRGLQVHPTRTQTDKQHQQAPKLALSDLWHLFDQYGGALQVANIIRENPELSKRIWFDEIISDEFITALVRQTNIEAVEAVVFSGRPRRHTLAAAVLAFSAKKSVRGVASMERLAFKRRMLQGPDSADLWFALVRAYGALERLDSVRKSFKAARDAGAWSPQSTRHTNIYLNAIHMDIHLTFIRARQLMDAGAVVDTTTFNILLKACMRAKDGKRAGMAIKWMKSANVVPDTVTWSSLIKVRSYTDDFKGVLAIRDAMEKEGFEPTAGVWGSLLVACGAAQHHETALMMWREAKAALGGPASVPPNLYNAMLTACNACGQGERTLSLLEEMKSAGVIPGVKSYNLAIKACEGQPGQRLRLEQLAIALKLYEEMRTCGMHPDLITYGTLIELCAEGRQGALARRLRDRMDEDGVKPNVVVMTSLLKALARAGLVEDCLETFGTMVWGPARVRPNRVTFRTLVRELRQAGALGAALRAYEGMRRAQHAPSNVEFQELIAAAAEAALAEGDPELQAQVASLCNISSTLEILDLHGMSTLEARAAVLCMLSMLMTEYHDTGLPPLPLTIITGKGVHSESGQAVLPGTVYRLLSEELHMHVDAESSNNPGRLIIDPEILLRWVRARVATRQQHQRAKKKAANSTIDDS